MLKNRTTLAQFLTEQQRRGRSSISVNALVLDVSVACKAISRRVALGALPDSFALCNRSDTPSEVRLDDVAHDLFIEATERGGQLTGILAQGHEDPHRLPTGCPKGEHLLMFTPLEGSSSLDVNVPAGSIFSILPAPTSWVDACPDDFRQVGRSQVAAGYAIYGPSTILMITLGRGVDGFTLDESLGEFFLTHPSVRVPTVASEFAIDHANRRFWGPAVLRYVDECLAGKSGPREQDFHIRWVASLVAEAHRILLRGGVFLYPQGCADSERSNAVARLYEANPIAFVMEQAGGFASTGHERVLDVPPKDLHEKVPSLFFGAREEITRLERYHDEAPLSRDDQDIELPLYSVRGLFRDTSW